MANIAIKDLPGRLQTTDIGKRYHVGLGVPSASDPTKLNMYGYNLVRKDSGGGDYHEKSDAKTRDTLSAVGSPNVTDRDLSPVPHVTDGDFSGGGLQHIFIDAKQYYDSDMEIRVAGKLQLRPAWARRVHHAQTAGPSQAVYYAGDVYVTYGDGSGIYNSAGLVAGGPPVTQTIVMDTDGIALFGADGGTPGKLWSYLGGAWTTVSSTLPAGVTQIWGVNLATNGHWLYYLAAGVLHRLDLNTQPNPPDSLVPMGAAVNTIIDVVPYGGGVAILVNETSSAAMVVYYHDGFNLQLMLRLRGYSGQGLTDCMGQMYVTAQSLGTFEPPILLQVGSGQYNIVGRFGSSLNQARNALMIGAPISSGQYVAFTLVNAQLQGITPTPYVMVFDVLAGSLSHLPNLDATDMPGRGVRGLAWLGRALMIPMNIAAGNVLQFQTNQQAYLPPAPVPIFTPTGQLETALFDFNTPGLTKQFRRVTARHTGLNAGESVTVQIYVDRDPELYVTGVTPPAATVTHSYANGDPSPQVTVLNIPSHKLGLSAYAVVKVAAGTGGLTAPVVFWLSIEISAPWTYDLEVDCTRDIRTLDGREDALQLEARDRLGMLRNAYENGQPLTMWDFLGQSRLVNIADYDFRATSPMNQADGLHRADLEGYVKLVLTETVV